MAPRVLYFCPCSLASELASSERGEAEAQAGPSSPRRLPSVVETQDDEEKPAASSSSSLRQQPAVIDAIPPLPCFDKAARYSHYALEELYYCEECEQIKCKRCTTSEVSAYFCPICLFDVQPANVKADRNRCAHASKLQREKAHWADESLPIIYCFADAQGAASGALHARIHFKWSRQTQVTVLAVGHPKRVSESHLTFSAAGRADGTAKRSA